MKCWQIGLIIVLTAFIIDGNDNKTESRYVKPGERRTGRAEFAPAQRAGGRLGFRFSDSPGCFRYLRYRNEEA